MWTASRAPSRPQRTASVHSIASVHSQTSRPPSMVSSSVIQRRSGYDSDQSSDTANDDDVVANFPAVPGNTMPAMWQAAPQTSRNSVSRLSQKFASNINVAEFGAPPPLRTQHRHPQDAVENSPDEDTHSRASTLGGEEEYEMPEKTPTSLPPRNLKISQLDDEPSSPAPAPHVPGPLESQLAALMSKLIFIEQKNPVISVTPEDYKEMKARLQALEEEKKTWTKRHEAIWALRDEDVENNIKIRGMLAKARRDLEAMTKLRDEDLANVQIVRTKLAEATRQLERQQQSNGRVSPSRGRPASTLFERRDTTNLFEAAKAAALEQRALELEKRNSDLLSQIETLKGGAGIDDLNRMTAHKAWKDTVADLEAKVRAKDAEIARMKTAGGAAGGAAVAAAPGAGIEWAKVEAIHEEHASYREKVGGRLQALRGEKEALQRELHRKEDENHALEVKVKSLERRITLM